MKRWLFILLLASHPALSIAQTLAVNYRDTITVPLPGALAAFSMNDFYAEAKAESGMLTVYGRNPGSAHIVIVTVEGSRIFEVRILPAPPSYPPGFVYPLSAATARENGSFECRFTSDPSQLENIVDFMRHEGDREVSFHLAGTIGFIPYADRSTFAFSSVFYQIITPDRDITLLDQLVSNSPLTVYDSIVRGFHLRQGKFFFHTGYTSATAFENLILPAQKQGLVGLGYRFSAGSHAYLMPNFYLFSGTQTVGNPVQRGAVASLVYHYAPRKNLGLLAEAGFSRGIGAAGQFHLLGAHDQITADLRYQPMHFAALSLNNLHGFYSDFDWTRHLTSRFTSTFNFTGNHYKLPALDLTNLLANMGLQLQLSRHWSVSSGLIYSRFQSHLPLGPAIATTGLPMGISFDSVHFQNSFMYEYSRGSGPVSRSDEFRATLGTHWSGFHWDGFVDRQTQAMSIAFTATGTPALQDALNNLGVSATTPEQVALALGETAGLLNEKLIQGINISVTPIRLQAGSYLSWSNRARSRQRFDFRLLYNDNQLQHGENRTTTGTFAYSLKFKSVNEIVSSVSRFHNGGHSGQSAPIFAISIRRQIGSAPNFIISRRRGTISGIAFADDGATGAYRSGGSVLPDVEVLLDDARLVRTDQAGRYMFTHVSYGSHTVEAVYHSAHPFFFTTASRVQSDINAEVNFGIGASFARLFGSIRSDTGFGLAGVYVTVSKDGQQSRARTDAEGKFRAEGLSSGEYDIQIDVDSVPPGYSLAGPMTKRTTVDPAVPAQSAFILNAIRNISGRVTAYDRATQQEIPVPGTRVILRGLARECVTDKNGIYLFRDLRPGFYSLVVVYQGKESGTEVTLPDGPAFPKAVDIKVDSN